MSWPLAFAVARTSSSAQSGVVDRKRGGRPFGCAGSWVEGGQSNARTAIHSRVRWREPCLEGFDVWTPSMGFYVVFVWVCAR